MAILKDLIVLGASRLQELWAPTIHGELDGNAATADIATKSGIPSIYLYPENNNELNIGGSNTGTTIYIGFRAKDNRPLPTKYVFGGGSAAVQASSFIKNGGSSSQFLKADGSVDSNSYALSSALNSYLPLTGGTLTGNLILNGTNNQSKNLIPVSGGTYYLGMPDALWGGVYASKVHSAYFESSDDLYHAKDEVDGIVNYKIWDASNHGAGSGLNADLLDGQHGDFYFGELIIGTNTAASANWTGVSKLATANDLKSGYRFTYWKPYSYGSGNQTMTLTFQDGTTKTINLYLSGSSRITSHFGPGRYISFVYLENANVNGTDYTGAWVSEDYYSDTTYVMYSNYERRFIHDANTPLYRYKLFGYDINGKAVPLTITNQTSATIVDKTPCSVPMDVSRGISWYGTTTNITAIESTFGTIYNEYTNSYCVYTFNENVPAFVDVFLAGTYNHNTGEFTMDTTSHTSWYVFAPNRPSDGAYTKNFVSGKYYWYVGATQTSTNLLQLKINNPCYYFDGTRLIDVHISMVTFIGRDLIPAGQGAYSLGSQQHPWNNIYGTELYLASGINSVDSSSITTACSIIPTTNNAFRLGSTTKKFLNVYTSEITFAYDDHIDDFTNIYLNGANLCIHSNSKLALYAEDGVETNVDLTPSSNKVYYLGNSSLYWKGVYTKLIQFSAGYTIQVDSSEEVLQINGHDEIMLDSEAISLKSPQLSIINAQNTTSISLTSAGLSFTGAAKYVFDAPVLAPNIGGGGSGTEWYNIRAERFFDTSRMAYSDDIFAVIENYTSTLTDNTQYRFVLMRWRRARRKGNSWHIPFLEALRRNMTTSYNTISDESAIRGVDTWWSIGGVKTSFFSDSHEIYPNIFPLDRIIKHYGNTCVWQNNHNKKMRFGCAIFKYTGKGHYGWERVSNIAAVELYAVKINHYFISLKPM